MRRVRELADDADFEARSRNRSVTLKTAEMLTVVGTEHLLRRAIENVVRNAVHYTADGPTVVVELVLESNEACESGILEKKQSDKSLTRCAVIRVRDHGPGVPENALHEIFRPFYRVDDARDREAGGVGLGLAIAERAVRLHGGEVKANNLPDGGLVVKIKLPVNSIDD